MGVEVRQESMVHHQLPNWISVIERRIELRDPNTKLQYKYTETMDSVFPTRPTLSPALLQSHLSLSHSLRTLPHFTTAFLFSVVCCSVRRTTTHKHIIHYIATVRENLKSSHTSRAV